MTTEFSFDEPRPPPVVVSTSPSDSSISDETELSVPVDVSETSSWLAGALVIIVVIGWTPAAIKVIDRLKNDDAPDLARWVFLVGAAGAIQFAYAIYLAQLPDWSSLWCTSAVAVAVAATYALVAGLTFSPESQSAIVSWLELRDELPTRRATAWCALMLLTTGGWAYLAGRFALRARRGF